MKPKIRFIFNGSPKTGYGVHASNLKRELENMCELTHNAPITIVLNTVNHPDFYKPYKGYKIAYNVWESTLYPQEFFNKLLEFDELWVPSHWQKDCAVAQGYPAEKIFVVPEGVDPEKFYVIDEGDRISRNKNFQFLVVGKWEHRKATKEIIETYLKTFKHDDEVELLLMVDNPFSKETTEEKLSAITAEYHKYTEPAKIKIVPFQSEQQYIALLRGADAFISCSRAEGWNLPLIEAMACGVPAVCSKYGAQLEFHKYDDWQVNIKGHDIPKEVIGCEPVGTWAEPDFDHLSRIMKDLFGGSNYAFGFSKFSAIKNSYRITENFTWKIASVIATNRLRDIYKNIPEEEAEPFKAVYSYIEGAKVEIITGEGAYKVEFIDNDSNDLIFQTTITAGQWAKTSVRYFKDVKIVVSKNNEIVDTHEFNAEGKKALIRLDSKSFGDTIAWFPYCVEFKKKHKCDLFVSTFHNYLFQKEYPEIKFIKASENKNVYAEYRIGVYEDKDSKQKNLVDWRTIPLQKIASDILGLEYEEIKPRIDTTGAYKKKNQVQKYICISEHSTAVCKYWHHPNAWQTLVNLLNAKGYTVVCISKERTALKNVVIATENPIQITMGILANCEMYIGLASGLAWLSWALGKKTVVISGFSEPFVEMQDCIRIEGQGDCTGCLNDIFIPHRSWDEGCFHDRNFQCTRLITPEMVMEKIVENTESFNITQLDFTTAPILRYSKRQSSFKKFLTEVSKQENHMITEIGCTRRNSEDPDLAGDGNSTSIFAWFLQKHDGFLYCVDISEDNIETAKQNLIEQGLLSEKIIFYVKDGIDFARMNSNATAVYIDGFDYAEGKERESAGWHLEVAKIYHSYKSCELIMIDDVFDSITFKGKGELAIPWLLETKEWEMIYCEYQAILKRK